MSDTKPFLISHPDGREYELSDVAAFQTIYQPEGFAIVTDPRTGYGVPETVETPAPDLSAMTRAELNEHAASIGVGDPHTLPNKDAVIAAIGETRTDTRDVSSDAPVTEPETS